MLNYWVGLVLFVGLIVSSIKVNQFKGWLDHHRQLAVIDENIQKLKAILLFAQCLLFCVWGSMLYVAACAIKFIVSLF